MEDAGCRAMYVKHFKRATRDILTRWCVFKGETLSTPGGACIPCSYTPVHILYVHTHTHTHTDKLGKKSGIHDEFLVSRYIPCFFSSVLLDAVGVFFTIYF